MKTQLHINLNLSILSCNYFSEMTYIKRACIQLKENEKKQQLFFPQIQTVVNASQHLLVDAVIGLIKGAPLATCFLI